MLCTDAIEWWVNLFFSYWHEIQKLLHVSNLQLLNSFRNLLKISLFSEACSEINSWDLLKRGNHWALEITNLVSFVYTLTIPLLMRETSSIWCTHTTDKNTLCTTWHHFYCQIFTHFCWWLWNKLKRESMDHLKQGSISILHVPDLSGRPATTCVSSSSSSVVLYCARVENPLHWCQFLIVSIICAKNFLLMQNPQLQGPWDL